MGSIVWNNDAGWDKPLVNQPGRERYEALDKYLYKQGLLCVLSGVQLVFVDVSNSWHNLVSAPAVMRINGLMDIKNATVNYDSSFVPYIDHLMKRCNSNVSKLPSTSVCIGTKRLEIEISEDGRTLTFLPGKSLLPKISSEIHDSVLSVCYMPASHTVVPQSFVAPGLAKVLDFIGPLFHDSRDLCTLLWHIGNSVVDPISKPKSLLLQGPGGSGKSTVLRMLANSLEGCCGTLLDGSLTRTTKSSADEVARVVVSSRMAICYEVDLEESPLNMSVFKNISGSDTIRIGQVSCKTSCSLTLATNGLVDVKKQPLYTSDAIMRRVMCLEMNVRATDAPYAPDPDTTLDKTDFLCMAIHTRLRFPVPPVSPMSLLLTLCGSEVFNARQLIEEKADEKPTLSECRQVLLIIAGLIDCSTEEVAWKARLVSSLTVFEHEGVTYIKGLAPI